MSKNLAQQRREEIIRAAPSALSPEAFTQRGWPILPESSG